METEKLQEKQKLTMITCTPCQQEVIVPVQFRVFLPYCKNEGSVPPASTNDGM